MLYLLLRCSTNIPYRRTFIDFRSTHIAPLWCRNLAYSSHPTRKLWFYIVLTRNQFPVLGILYTTSYSLCERFPMQRLHTHILINERCCLTVPARVSTITHWISHWTHVFTWRFVYRRQTLSEESYTLGEETQVYKIIRSSLMTLNSE